MTDLSEFVNPIVPGFAPDPSIVFVKDTFFLVNSSFHIFPGLPIYASKDLKRWTHIGNAINRRNQISFASCGTHGFIIKNGAELVASGELFAPTIRFNNGTFYIICTNCLDDGTTLNFYISTKNIWYDDWSDPAYFEFSGIDPSLFFDDDGRAYVQGSAREGKLLDRLTSIKQFEIDLNTGEAISEVKRMWAGFTKRDTEGPHLYKKDGYYFLVVAEDGTFEDHLIAIARSTNIWGPYESYENNPILTARGTTGYIQNTGHGDLFQDGKGQWWITFLGVRNEDGRYPLGRETFLAPVTWPIDGWPQIEQPQMRFRRSEVASGQWISDELLERKRPHLEDVYIRDANLKDYQFSEDGRTITLHALSTDLSTPLVTASFLGRRQRSLSCTATVTLRLGSTQTNKPLAAGLTVYKDDFRHMKIYYDFNSSSVVFLLRNKLKGDLVTVQHSLSQPTSISFRVEAVAKMYEFSYLVENSAGWTSLGSIDTKEITILAFTGAIFGIFASTTKDHEGCPVAFIDFQIESANLLGQNW